MKKSEQDQYIIEQYEQNERAMILIYAQWCINEELDPLELYERAYPNQPKNESLIKAIEKTVPKEEVINISFETVIQALQMFGNDDLAFVISEAYTKK